MLLKWAPHALACSCSPQVMCSWFETIPEGTQALDKCQTSVPAHTNAHPCADTVAHPCADRDAYTFSDPYTD